MPVYIYRCDNCGVQFDKLQSFNDQPLKRCPECGKKVLKKVYQPVRIVFKGSGFYATDHHSPSGESNLKEKESGESQETPTKEATAKPENKPEAKEKPAS